MRKCASASTSALEHTPMIRTGTVVFLSRLWYKSIVNSMWKVDGLLRSEVI
jgi:hypothetical protein